MSGSSSRIPQLDGLRGLAIAAVFATHAWHVKLLWMGVDLFFVLSGFLITGILLHEKNQPFGAYIGHFYARRARRILPAYVLALAVTAFVFGFGWLRYWYLYLGGMNFLLPLHLPTPETLPLWSLAVEEQFYLLWPLAVYRLNRRQLMSCAMTLLVAAPLLCWICTPLFSEPWPIYMLLPFRMDTLAAGALAALAWPEVRRKLAETPELRWQIGFGCISFLILGLASIALLARHGDTTYGNTRLGNFGIYEAALAIVSSIFLGGLLGIGKRVLSAWPLVSLGRISYSVYLIHLTAIDLAPNHNGAVAALGSISYAAAMWFLVERPLLKGGREAREAAISAI